MRKRMLPAAFCGALMMAAAAQGQDAQPCAGLPPGRHALLERLTASMNLTCEQQLKIEPLLHDEESVTKPLLKFTALPANDEQAIMTTIKLAARRQVRQYLTADQQKAMDSEVDSVSKGGSKGGKKKGGSKQAETAPGYGDEETLCSAIVAYTALTPGERKDLLLKVKTAALADSDLGLTAEQKQKLETEIRSLK